MTPSREHGFSLFEMLVVLAIVALAVAAVLPNMREGGDLRAQASQIAALLRLARTEAMFANDERSVNVDFGDHRIAFEAGGKSVALGDTVALSVLTAREEIVEDDARIRFLPDGSSTGGAIVLEGSGRAVRIKIHWLTGAVSVDAAR